VIVWQHDQIDQYCLLVYKVLSVLDVRMDLDEGSVKQVIHASSKTLELLEDLEDMQKV
jgi:hypothetical protein